MTPRRNRQRGALLGIVLVLLVVLLAAGMFAFFGLRTDTAASTNERLSRQLFDCAEQGLAIGKQFFSQETLRGSAVNAYLQTNVCVTGSYLLCAPNGPFPANQAGAPPFNYPMGVPFRNTLFIGDPAAPGTGLQLNYQIGVLNDPGDTGGPTSNQNNAVVVYSKCVDPTTNQWRAVQALITMPDRVGRDYRGQAGRGFQNQGNANF